MKKISLLVCLLVFSMAGAKAQIHIQGPHGSISIGGGGVVISPGPAFGNPGNSCVNRRVVARQVYDLQYDIDSFERSLPAAYTCPDVRRAYQLSRDLSNAADRFSRRLGNYSVSPRALQNEFRNLLRIAERMDRLLLRSNSLGSDRFVRRSWRNVQRQLQQLRAQLRV